MGGERVRLPLPLSIDVLSGAVRRAAPPTLTRARASMSMPRCLDAGMCMCSHRPCSDVYCPTTARMVMMPSATRAGVAAGSIKKPSMDIQTRKMAGMK